jgi:hypothetical protein
MGRPPRTRRFRKALAAEGIAASDFSRLRACGDEELASRPADRPTRASSRASATRPGCTYSPRYREKRANTLSANRRAGPSALSMSLQRAVRRVRLWIGLRTRAPSGASMPDVLTRGGRLVPERATRLAFVSPVCRQRLIESGWVARRPVSVRVPRLRKSVHRSASSSGGLMSAATRCVAGGETTGRELVAAAAWIVTAGRSLSIRPMSTRQCVAKDY